MNKYLKYTLIAIPILIPIGFIIGFSKAWNSPPSITTLGSTAVQPLLSSISNIYNDADVTVQPGGSSLGLKVAAEASKDLGNASKNPYYSVQKAEISKNGFDLEMWTKNELKTVTIAWDGIAIIYKPNNINEETLVINNENISKIYQIFSGTKQYKLDELFIGVGNKKTNYKNNNYIVPYSRTGGSNASGTATSFLKESGFIYDLNSLEKEEEILETGKYLGNVRTTNESNVESWNRFSIENEETGMIYLSLGFAELNREIIEKKGYRIAKYNNTNESKNNIDATIANITNKKYGWYSPLNTIIPIAKSTLTTKEFVWWLLTDDELNRYSTNKKEYGYIQKCGYAPLNNEDKIKMFLQTNNNITIENFKEKKDVFFMSNDINLHNENKKEWYGVPKK